MKVLSHGWKHDDDTGEDYYHTEAEDNGRFIEVNSDARGHYVRLDREPLTVQHVPDDVGLVKFIYFLFGKR